MFTKAVFIQRPFIAISVLMVASIFSWLPGENLTRHFAGVGSGDAGRIAFRTQFELTNPTDSLLSGELSLMARDGSSWTGDWTSQFIGAEGRIIKGEGTVGFTIPDGSALVLILEPSDSGALGWATLNADSRISVQAHLLVAEIAKEVVPIEDGFEHYVLHSAGITETLGAKSLSFPIWYFAGMKQINSALSVVNLAAGEARIRFTLDEQISKEITLGPGELLADYLDTFFELGFPEVFPFEMRSLLRIESSAPLAASVLRTVNGLPFAEVKPTRLERASSASHSAGFSEEVTLALGEQADFGEELSLEFWNVKGDSRCPVDVVCVWEGEATIELFVKNGEHSERVLLSTLSEKNTAQIFGYEIRLIALEPLPVAERPTPIGEYKATVIVTRG